MVADFVGLVEVHASWLEDPQLQKKIIKHITIKIKSNFLCLILEKKIEHITIEIKSIFLLKKLSLKTLLNIFITIYYQVSNMMIHLRS